MARILIWAGAAVLTIVLAIGVYLAMLPGLALTRLQDQITGATGRALMVAGGAHLEVAPQLALRLDDVALANPAGIEGNVLGASSIRFPLSFADLLRPGASTGTITLVDPRFHRAWDFQVDASFEQAVDSHEPHFRPAWWCSVPSKIPTPN